jgi:hypothetical protein
MHRGDEAYASPAEKVTDDRTYTVYGGKTLELPVLSMADLRVASSPSGEAFVKQTIHDESMNGFPLVELYGDHGIVLHPLNPTTSHVLVVVDAKKALEMLAMVHKAYELLGYTLIFDETTVLITLPPREESNDVGEVPSSSQGKEKPQDAVAPIVTSQQSKLDVLGMEVA